MYCLFHFCSKLQLYGIDAASGAAVSAMNISVGDHVLDLCAAPGKEAPSVLLLYIEHVTKLFLTIDLMM